MTDLNAPLDPTERDALAWRMLEEGLDMQGIDIVDLWQASHDTLLRTPERVVTRIVHDALAYRRQT